MLDLERMWGVVDGVRTDGVVGLESFLRQTERNGNAVCSWCTMA